MCVEAASLKGYRPGSFLGRVAGFCVKLGGCAACGVSHGNARLLLGAPLALASLDCSCFQKLPAFGSKSVSREFLYRALPSAVHSCARRSAQELQAVQVLLASAGQTVNPRTASLVSASPQPVQTTLRTTANHISVRGLPPTRYASSVWTACAGALVFRLWRAKLRGVLRGEVLLHWR